MSHLFNRLLAPAAAGAVNLTGLIDFGRNAASALTILAGVLAIVFFLVGVIQYQGSAVDYRLAENGKQNMMRAVASACLAAGALTIVNVFLGGFGLPLVSL